MTIRKALGHGALLIAAACLPTSASAQCSCQQTSDPSFTRTILTAYAGELDAFVAAQNVERREARILRSIAKGFRKAERLVRKGQVLRIGGDSEAAQKHYKRAVDVVDELAGLIDKAGQAGLLRSTPGDRLGDRRTALGVEVARIADNPPGESCYHACKQVCGDADMVCNGLAFTGKCTCMMKECYPYCGFIAR